MTAHGWRNRRPEPERSGWLLVLIASVLGVVCVAALAVQGNLN